jgi:hypothetical protein
MKLILLSIITSAVIGTLVAVFLRFKKYFDKQYDQFEDERYRAVAGSQHEEKKNPDDAA